MSDLNDIILKYLKDNISLEDQHKLTKWLEENDYNEEVLRKVKTYWLDYNRDYSSEKKAVADKVFGNIGAQRKKASRKRSMLKNYLNAAAVILLLFSAAAIYWKISPPMTTPNDLIAPVAIVEKSSLSGQKITTVLPDGTTVRLNSGSKLLVPEKFSENIRSVELIGEAFFDVVKDETKPFQIRTKDFTVKVLGTSFNINAYGEATSYVAVKEGVVSVKSDSHRSVELNADQMVQVSTDGQLSELYEVDENMVFGWVDQILSFEDQSINQVLKKISLWYGVEMKVDKKAMPKKLFTGTFSNPTLKELMVNVSKVYGFEYEITDDKVMIR